MDPDLASIQQARDLARKAKAAFEVYRRFSQEAVDGVCQAMVDACRPQYARLARLAVEESGFGIVESKIEKTRFAVESTWADIRGQKTAGIIRRDEGRKYFEIAEPYGVIVGIIPITNPTSTALFKVLIALKTRNAIVLSPHPRGVRCIAESARVAHEAAVRAGAPEGVVGCLTNSTLAGTNELMRGEDTDLILATGGMGLVRAAYSSGKPAYGVGPGNAPAYIDRSADVRHAVRCIVASQTFDNSTICASEQSVVADLPVSADVLAEFARQGAHVCSPDENRRLEKVVVVGRSMNPDIVGQYPWRIAEMAGFTVPRETTVLVCPYEGVGWDYPLSIEKLSPILSYYALDGWEACCKKCIEVLRFGGMGHTLAIHARDEAVIMRFAMEKPAYRILVNAPAAQGAVGYATNLEPSMTLGCGTYGGNITADNVTARHLINIKKVGFVKDDFFAAEGLAAPVTGAAAGGGASATGRGRGTETGVALPEDPTARVPVRPYLAAGWVGGARAEAPAARPRSDPRRSDARPAPPAPTPTPGPEERNPAAPTTAAHQPAAEVAHLVAPTTSHGRMGEPMNARIAGGVMAAAEIRRLIEQRSRAPHTCAVKNCTVGDCGHCV